MSCDHQPGETYPLGPTLVTCTATDASNNSATQTFTVTVTYGFSGFLQPINAAGSSVFRAGSTVPVKFALTGASAGISNAVATLGVVCGAIDGPAVQAVSTSAATTGNLFRYDATSGQYVFNWSTRGRAAGTYWLTADLGDGSSHVVQVSLR